MRRFDITIRPRDDGKTMYLIHEYFEHFSGAKVLFISATEPFYVKDVLYDVKVMMYLDAAKLREEFGVLLIDDLDKMEWIVVKDIISNTNPYIIKATAGMDFLLKVHD